MQVGGFGVVESFWVWLVSIGPLSTCFLATICHQYTNSTHNLNFIVWLVHLPNKILHTAFPAKNIHISNIPALEKWVDCFSMDKWRPAMLLLYQFTSKNPIFFNLTIYFKTQKLESRMIYLPVEKYFFNIWKKDQLFSHCWWQSFPSTISTHPSGACIHQVPYWHALVKIESPSGNKSICNVIILFSNHLTKLPRSNHNGLVDCNWWILAWY